MLALADGERPGYGIMQSVTAPGGGGPRLGPGTLYGSIKRLLDAAMIEASEQCPDVVTDDERRCYYRLTDFGRRVAAAEAARLAALVRLAQRRRLLPGPFVYTATE